MDPPRDLEMGQAEALAREIAAREQAEADSAEIRSILERISDAYIAFDTEWRYTYVNRKAAELALRPASELIGKCVWDLFPEAVTTPFYSELQRSMREQVPVSFDNYFKPLGKWFENSVYPSPAGVSVFYRDVTERILIHRALEARTAELARKNAELEMFAYVASHDLQEPLRMVGSYASLLGRRYADALDSDAREFIEYITGGVTRMQRLIRDLLALCRLEEAPVSDVDVSRIAGLACDHLSLLIEDTGATVEKNQLPVVKFNESQLLQVVQNLIGNALRYRGETPPRVVLASQRYDGGYRISISDNGAGLNMQFASEIFKPFRRLQAKDDGGTGIGLAVCKKIIETRGGKIWVDSSPGKGSTFYFTIPETVPGAE